MILMFNNYFHVYRFKINGPKLRIFPVFSKFLILINLREFDLSDNIKSLIINYINI
jgi:hypothetical protein